MKNIPSDETLTRTLANIDFFFSFLVHPLKIFISGKEIPKNQILLKAIIMVSFVLKP